MVNRCVLLFTAVLFPGCLYGADRHVTAPQYVVVTDHETRSFVRIPGNLFSMAQTETHGVLEVTNRKGQSRFYIVKVSYGFIPGEARQDSADGNRKLNVKNLQTSLISNRKYKNLNEALKAVPVKIQKEKDRLELLEKFEKKGL